MFPAPAAGKWVSGKFHCPPPQRGMGHWRGGHAEFVAVDERLLVRMEANWHIGKLVIKII